MPISFYSDDELLSAIKQDDEKAYKELFERYWEHVHAITYHMVLSMEATHEIVQNVFVALWEQRTTLSKSNLPLSLNLIIKNCVLKYMGPELVHKKHCDNSQSFVDQHLHVVDYDVKVNELMQARECGINYHPEKSKKILSFHSLEEPSIVELARRLTSLKRLFNSISHNQQKG